MQSTDGIQVLKVQLKKKMNLKKNCHVAMKAAILRTKKGELPF